MFKKKNDFLNKKIGEIENYTGEKAKSWINLGSIIRFIIISICIFAVFFLGKYIISFAQANLGIISKSSIKIISQNIGQEMNKDEFGNVNILIVGYGGEEHDGGYLSDSIMVASRNPKLGAVTLISIPRDLQIANPITRGTSRVNVLFSQMYNRRGDLLSGAAGFSEKISEILGLQINYYAVIDFEGFEKVIDTLGGIDIIVKNTIYDTTYPDGKKGYMTFHLNAGEQHLDGKTALMYARSRHTTSDFDRSLRQQQIIAEVKNKILQGGYMTNVSKIKELYSDYTQMVSTNISLKEIIGMIKHIDNTKHIFSFGINSDCSYLNFRNMKPGCFLYVPNRDLFQGASVLLPEGSTISRISFYDHIHKFVFLVSHNQEYLIESAEIKIQNGIDKSFARSLGRRADGNSSLLAAKLKKYGFNISSTENAPNSIEKTTVYIPSTGDFISTTKVLQLFLNFEIVVDSSISSGNQIVMVLGNDYIQSIKDIGFKNNL